MKLLTILTSLIVINAQNVPKEIQNILNVLSLLKIKPESYIKLATNANETQCNQDIATILKESAKRELWALMLLDSNGKLPDSLKKGNRIAYGDFEQCLQLKIPHNFQPQYCLLSINVIGFDFGKVKELLRFPLVLFGVCVPSTCSPQYIERILQNVQFPSLGKNISQSLDIFIVDGNCFKPDDTTVFTPLNWITSLFLSTIVLFVLVSTIYEAFFPSKDVSLFTSFSLLTTGRDIFAPSDSAKPISGFRGVLACIVVIGHFHLQINNGNNKNMTYFKMNQDTLLIPSGVNLLDAFLILAAISTVMAFYKEVATKKSYDPVKAVVNRYFRLNIPAGVVILIRLGIFEHLHRGPVYNAFNRYQTRHCDDAVMSILLAYDNFKNPRVNQACFVPFWYLSLDMQLFLFTQILFIIWRRKPNMLYPIAFVLLILSDVLTFYLSYIHDCGWTVLLSMGNQFLDNVYTFPYTRGVSWFAGILWAGIILKTRKTDFSEHKGMQKIMWLLTIVCLYYSHEYLRGKRYGEHTQPEAAFYSAFHHITSAIAYGWIIYALINKISGPLGVFLSWGPMVFLGSLSYEIYLTHFTIIDFLQAIARHNVYYTYNRILYHSIAVIGFSTVAALVFALCITRPIANLSKLATRGVKIMPIPFEIHKDTETTDHDKNA